MAARNMVGDWQIGLGDLVVQEYPHDPGLRVVNRSGADARG